MNIANPAPKKTGNIEGGFILPLSGAVIVACWLKIILQNSILGYSDCYSSVSY